MQLFEFINVIIEIVIMMFYCNNIFNSKQTLNKVIKYAFIVLATGTAILINMQHLDTGLNLAISYCIYFAIAYFLYEGTITTKLFVGAIYVVILIFSDILAMTVITFFEFKYGMLRSVDVSYIVNAMFSDFIRLWLLAYVGKVLSRRIHNLPLFYWIFLFICPILSAMCLVIFYVLFMQAETNSRILIFIPSLCILYINFMLFRFFENFSNQIKMKVIKELAQNEEENYKILQNNETELRKLRHDMKNHIMMLHEYLKHDAVETALQHLSNIQDTLEEISVVVCTNNPAIDAAINIGARKAQSENIEYKVQIIGEGNIFIEAADVCKFLCNAIDNAIDNAIEACIQCDEKYVYIEINISKDDLKIHIENPTLVKPDKNIFLTSKVDKENHGYGISNMKNVVKKYDGIMSVKVKNDIFYLDTILYNSRKNTALDVV